MFFDFDRKKLKMYASACDVCFSGYRVATPGIVVCNLLAVIAGPLLLNASFIALALRCVAAVVSCSTAWAKFHSARYEYRKFLSKPSRVIRVTLFTG